MKASQYEAPPGLKMNTMLSLCNAAHWGSRFVALFLLCRFPRLPVVPSWLLSGSNSLFVAVVPQDSALIEMSLVETSRNRLQPD